MTGTIFDIKRFAVHDGPGIRTTLFLKGCPLRCPWCQNPEGLSGAIRLWHKPSLCILCGSCVKACKYGALEMKERIHIDHSRCVKCGDCIAACPTGALAYDGQEVTVLEAVDMLLQDRMFFDKGGVTLSGGEALQQWPFALEVLTACHEQGVNTALETSLYVRPEVLEKFLPVVDHFLIDIKYKNGDTHREVIGADNALILSNYAFLVKAGADVLVRTPLIPGFTATEDNIRGIARHILAQDRDARYELLNFNPLCRSKYTAMEMDYCTQERAFTESEMASFYRMLEEEGVKNIIKE